jgi:predicted ATPase
MIPGGGGSSITSLNEGTVVMLTWLRFKNWRSLRNVEINLFDTHTKRPRPLTVLIGANSSGKTNILEALHFLRYAFNKGVVEAVYTWKGREKICTLGADADEPVELEFSAAPNGIQNPLTYTMSLRFDQHDLPFSLHEQMSHEQQLIWQRPLSRMAPHALNVKNIEFTVSPQMRDYYVDLSQRTFEFVMHRWQLLRENFIPPTSWGSGEPVDLYTVDPFARNVPFMLDFMHKYEPDLYNALQDDLRTLLSHVDKLETHSDDRETRFFIKETLHHGHEAPTISAGTARFVAMLTAFYSLNEHRKDEAGLVVIEEPDVSVHPLLFQRLVQMLRQYTSGVRAGGDTHR